MAPPPVPSWQICLFYFFFLNITSTCLIKSVRRKFFLTHANYILLPEEWVWDVPGGSCGFGGGGRRRSGVPFDTQHVSIILEGQVVMSTRTWTDSVVVWFGLIYALHLSYPEKLSGFFEFIQVVLLDLDEGRKQLKPKLQALRNELEWMISIFVVFIFLLSSTLKREKKNPAHYSC